MVTTALELHEIESGDLGCGYSNREGAGGVTEAICRSSAGSSARDGGLKGTP